MLKQVKQSVLIVVDVQNGFTPAVTYGVVPADDRSVPIREKRGLVAEDFLFG